MIDIYGTILWFIEDFPVTVRVLASVLQIYINIDYDLDSVLVVSMHPVPVSSLSILHSHP